MIRHFNIFPTSCDKENLFEEEKIFLIYLLANIPEIKEWRVDVDYQQQLEKIKKLKKVELDQTELDLAEISGKDIKELKREKLITEKILKIQELNRKFGIKQEEIEIEKVVETKTDKTDNNPQNIWEMLQGKGLVK